MTPLEVQVPLMHMSPMVHMLDSHGVLSGAFGFVQAPLVQIPATWHWSLAVQVI